MAIGYRSILRLDDNENAVKVANEAFWSWLSEMVRDSRKTNQTADWSGPGTHQLGPDSTLTVVEHVGDDNQHRTLLEYVETNSAGTWTTRLYATAAPHARRLKQVLWFESEGERGDGSPVQPGTPRVVRNILQTNDAFDGSVPVLSAPRIVRIDDVDELVGYIKDRDRDLSVIIAAPVPDVPTSKWSEAISTLTRDTVGCASFFVLEPDAAEELNARIGTAHSIPAGAVRTFAPQVELGDWADARRHRILTAKTMHQGLGHNLRFSERLVRAVAITPRLHLLEAEMPAELTRTVRILQRERIKPEEFVTPTPLKVITEDAAEPPIFDEFRPTWLDTLKNIVFRIIGGNVVNEATLQAIAEKFEQQERATEVAATNAESLQSERERLEDDLADVRRQLEAEQFERALADDSRRHAEKKTRALERWRAERTDKYTYVEIPPNASEADPVSVSEIIERLTDQENYQDVLKYVELTEVDKAIDRADEVDAVDSLRTYATAFWECVLVLRDYMEECLVHGFSGNVHMYLSSPDVQGRKCPTQRHRSNESDTVQSNPKMRKERTFAVPIDFDPSGELFMTAHFAPTHRDQNAPRMYYAIDLTGTRKAYIGYIGVHLTNTKTN